MSMIKPASETLSICRRCGKMRDSSSSNPCQCPRPPNFLRGKVIEGPRFVRIILAVCVGISLLAVGLFFLIVRLRVAHGLPGLD